MNTARVIYFEDNSPEQDEVTLSNILNNETLEDLELNSIGDLSDEAWDEIFDYDDSVWDEAFLIY